MKESEKYLYDTLGYLYIEDAIPPDLLTEINKMVDRYQENIKPEDQANNTIDTILNKEPLLLNLIDSPVTLPYIVEMVDQPRLKSTWITITWQGHGTGFHSNHSPTCTHNHYSYNNGIFNNLFQVFYALEDIDEDCGALTILPGSHKSNLPIPAHDEIKDKLVKIPMKAGSVLLFSHDIYHGSLNTREDFVRRVLVFTYCPGCIANSYEGGDTLYDDLHAASAEGSWHRFLLRRPHGFQLTEPRPSL